MLVKPAPGRKVRDPQSKQHIPETGVDVSESDTYWARRLLDGDVVVVKPEPVTKTASPKGKE